VGKINTIEDSMSIGSIDEEKIGNMVKNADEKIKYTNHTSSDSKYSIDVPDTWDVDKSVDGMTSIYDKASNRQVQINVTSTRKLPGKLLLIESTVEYRNGIAKKKTTTSIDENVKTVRMGELSCLHISYTTIENNKSSVYLTYFIHDEDKRELYQITFFCGETLLGQNSIDIFNTMIASFKFY